jgi:hypothetical protein
MRTVTDGPDAAVGSTMLIRVFMDADGSQSSVPFNVGEDHDRFVRIEQGWRFRSRRWVEPYKRGDRERDRGRAQSARRRPEVAAPRSLNSSHSEPRPDATSDRWT